MAVVRKNTKQFSKVLVPNDTLTSGITKVNTAAPIVASIVELGAEGSNDHYTIITTNTLSKTTLTSANLAFGEKIATFPLGRIQPLAAFVKLTSLAGTGLSGTAGEVGLGTVIGTGAVSTLGGTVAFNDIMDGTTLANHVAATTLTSLKANLPDATGTKPTDGVQVFDGSVTATNLHLNLASAWTQGASGTLQFQAEIHLHWRYIATGL